MAFFLYASFPNSRNKPRPATTNAFTYQVSILDYTQPLTLVAVATSNRTYILLKNLDPTYNFWYTYATTSAINPSVVARFGVVDALVYFTGTNTLYQKQDIGVTTNWVAVNIQDIGERVEPFQTASLDSPQDIYCATDSAIPVVPAVLVGVDQGTG
jgi:hypothetical protein